MRQENIDWQQYETKLTNERRLQHHAETSSKLKQLDRDKLLQSIQEKQAAAEQRIAQEKGEVEEQWKIFNEEEATKRKEREKKLKRNERKL